MRIKSKTRAEKSAKTRRRNSNPLRAAKLLAERPQPADGIERKVLSDGHVREKCLTHEARQERREELYARSGGKCESNGCRVVIYLDSFHLHHFKGRGRGKCDCMACIQAVCPDAFLQDGTTRFGCHTLAHQAIDESGRFDSEKSTRLGQPFQREKVDAGEREAAV